MNPANMPNDANAKKPNAYREYTKMIVKLGIYIIIAN